MSQAGGGELLQAVEGDASEAHCLVLPRPWPIQLWSRRSVCCTGGAGAASGQVQRPAEHLPLPVNVQRCLLMVALEGGSTACNRN